jgi:hypothetical protein
MPTMVAANNQPISLWKKSPGCMVLVVLLAIGIGLFIAITVFSSALRSAERENPAFRDLNSEARAAAEDSDDLPPLIEDRGMVLAKIRANAEAKWGTNFAMVEHEIDRQESAYREFLGYAAADHEIERQNGALNRLGR